MKLPNKPQSNAEILAVIRRSNELADFASTENERLLLLRGIVPKQFLANICGGYPIATITKLIQAKKVLETDIYLSALPRNRTRPIATEYSVEKPLITSMTRLQPYTETYRIKGRDRLLLWYAAANRELTGSMGEARGLYLILEFFRLPTVQKQFRKHVNPNWKLPEDAK